MFTNSCDYGTQQEMSVCALLRAGVSRFHSASVGGLIVGAMGCFIFGLYLRWWLRERRATAHQSERGMRA
jgi:hypothetical protein